MLGARLDFAGRLLVLGGTLLAGAGAGAGAIAAGSGAASDGLPPPRFGHTLDIGLVFGTVIVTLPSGRSFTLGPQDRNIPIRSLIDTTHGRVDLRAAPPPAAHAAAAATTRVEDAQFYQGAFKVRQAATSTVTQIRLAGGQFAQCSAAAARFSARRRLPHRVVRLLRASGSGRFQTDGRYAAATVRGTIWLTEDFCDGTLVRVSRGAVSVEDLVTHATVTVIAGHSFFARAP